MTLAHRGPRAAAFPAAAADITRAQLLLFTVWQHVAHAAQLHVAGRHLHCTAPVAAGPAACISAYCCPSNSSIVFSSILNM